MHLTKMFSSVDSPWDLTEFKREVATIWYPQFKKAFEKGTVDTTWGTNPNHAFVKWCWHNMVKFKEGIINTKKAR